MLTCGQHPAPPQSKPSDGLILASGSRGSRASREEEEVALIDRPSPAHRRRLRRSRGNNSSEDRVARSADLRRQVSTGDVNRLEHGSETVAASPVAERAPVQEDEMQVAPSLHGGSSERGSRDHQTDRSLPG